MSSVVSVLSGGGRNIVHSEARRDMVAAGGRGTAVSGAVFGFRSSAGVRAGRAGGALSRPPSGASQGQVHAAGSGFGFSRNRCAIRRLLLRSDAEGDPDGAVLVLR